VSLVISDHERAALAELAQFPLFAALTGRRSRRFPVGGRIPAGALAFTSRRPIQPLSEVERALLISVAGGVTGWNFGITHNPSYAPSFPNYAGSATGRTFPSAAGFHTPASISRRAYSMTASMIRLAWRRVLAMATSRAPSPIRLVRMAA